VEELSVSDFITEIWPQDPDLEWPALLSYLDRHQRRIEAHPHIADMAARLPSADSIPVVLQTQIWSLIIGRFDNRRNRPFQLLVPANDASGGITLFLRNLRPDDVFAFHPKALEYEHIEDLRASVPRGSRGELTSLTEAESGHPLRAFLDADFSPPSSVSARES
jgi:hypothetical protein